jgi:hypothetical protein
MSANLSSVGRTECVLGIDFGSTTTRASLFAHTLGFSDVGDSEHVYKTWQKNVFSQNEFPSLGRLKRGNPVGADAYGYHDSYLLKYTMYELAGLSESEINKYPPLDAFSVHRRNPLFRDQLRDLDIAFFHLIRRKVDRHCRVKNLTYSTLVLTMPTQWGGDGKPIQDAFESVIRAVWSEEIYDGNLHFIFEIEGLAHALIHEDKEELQEYEQILFVDLGGHSAVPFKSMTRSCMPKLDLTYK